MSLHEHFRDIFWDAFHRPKFLSERFRIRWEDLESVNELLSGPLFAMYECGHCDYVFEDKTRFSFVKEPEDFIAWLRRLCLQYRAAIEELSPQDVREEHDATLLRYQCDMKEELCLLLEEHYVLAGLLKKDL
ncbi:MAG: hypothetical protein MUF42_09045 [Cytophagaceae bacterium]|jgi:hypothetical protein|nr:hypothetical protein [Cytophagaceae bacterium]